MTQAIGLASALALLAFLLVLYALLAIAVRRFLEGDTQAARGPLLIFGVSVLIGLVSVFTWAGPAVGNAASSVSWAVESAIALVKANPLSLVCLGPLVFVMLVTLATPGARRCIGDNYLPLSLLVLAASFLALVVYVVMQLFGAWGVLALLVLVGLILGLGTRGLVFVPELNDGPRLGEGFSSSLLRMSGTKARRTVHGSSQFVTTLPSRMVSRQGAPVIGLVAVIALGGWWFSGRSEAQPELPVAVVVLSTPTSISPDSPPAVAATPAPAVSVLRVANTGGEGVLMREQSSRSGKPIATLPEGAQVEEAGPEQVADGITWRQVKEKGGKVGWVSTQYLATEQVYGLVRVANTGGEGVNLRAKAGKNEKAILLLKEGTELKIVGQDAQADGLTWRNVKDDKGNAGWVASQFLVEVP